MHDGWETRRRRGTGHDWAIIKLGAPGAIHRIEVDTSHFKGNYPDSCSDRCDFSNVWRRPDESATWRALLPQTKLRANASHTFRKRNRGRRNSFAYSLQYFPRRRREPIARLGNTRPGSRDTGVEWFNSLPEKKLRAGAPRLLRIEGMGAPHVGKPPILRTRMNSAIRRRNLERPKPQRVAAGISATILGSAPKTQHANSPRKPATGRRRNKSGVAQAARDTRAVLAAANRAYEAAFGHIFIICASGKSAEEIQQELHRRLGNDRETEMRAAAEEQRKITRLRLEKLLAS